MNKKETFVALKGAMNLVSDLSQTELCDKAYEIANTTFESLAKKMQSVLDVNFEWKFVDYGNKEVIIEIYDCLEVSISVYTGGYDEFCYDCDIFNPFTEEFIPFDLPENKALKDLMYRIWETQEYGEIKEIRDYVDLMRDAYKNYQRFKKILMDKVGATFEDVSYLNIEKEIIKKYLDLD